MILLFESGNEHSRMAIGKYLSGLSKGNYVVEIKKNHPVRSLSQNKYYHFILNVIAIHTGHTHEELHEAMKLKFNTKLISFPKGGSQIIGESTSNLDSKEFTSFINRVKQFALDEFSIHVPDPKDLDYQKWMEAQNQYERVISGM